MTSKPPRMAIQHNMLSTHIVCIAIYLLITDTFSTPTPVFASYGANRRSAVSNRLMRKSIVFLIWLSCSSLALGQLNGHLFLDEASSSVPTYVDPDAYLVYSIVINSILQQPNFQQGTTIAINDQTATAMEICFTPNKEHKAMLASAIANYVRVNKVPRRLLPRFNLDRH